LVEIDVREIRRRTGLNKYEFARRYGFARNKITGWEQGRWTPAGSDLLLLKLMALHPEIVEAILPDEDLAGVPDVGSLNPTGAAS